MSEGTIKRYSLEEIRTKKSSTDWGRLADQSEEELDGEFAVDWSTARIEEPRSKRAISLRVDPDILEFFKAEGKGYQTRINAVLRAYMNARRTG